MIELNISDVSKMYAATTIFEEITFTVKSGERVGLVGPNGCGKTTLLKMMMGREHITSGTISFRKGSTLGYLDQIPDVDETQTVIDILKDGLDELYQLQTQLRELSLLMSEVTGHALEKTLKTYTSVEETFALKGGYEIETKLAKVASGLHISLEMQEMPFTLLSGGEKTRVMLGHILLKNPSVLLLDEPSNHLDLDSIEWLENYLQSYEGSVLVVSHDRYFLDNVCQKIVELSFSKAHIYHGNYSHFVIERERRFLLELKVYLAQERKIKRMEEQIKQYRIWGTARDSEKMFKRAKELEKRLEKIERLDKPLKDPNKLKIGTDVSRTGKQVLLAHEINVSFDSLVLLENAEITLYFQDRLAILGDNGTGKTTLLKTLMDDYNLEEQKHIWGSKIKLGYLPQEVTYEDESLNLLDYFTKTHQMGRNEARRELAKALFTNDDVFKKIHQLSGGEKSRLKLASLTYEEVNFMILDEPTNHLDIHAREVLEELLLDYKGTILFVSHDRYFIQKIATRIAEIADCKLSYYEGDYTYYKAKKKQEKETQIVTNEQKKKTDTKPIKKEKQPSKEQLTEELEKMEVRLLEIESNMDEFAYDQTILHDLYIEKEELEELYEALFEELANYME